MIKIRSVTSNDFKYVKRSLRYAPGPSDAYFEQDQTKEPFFIHVTMTRLRLHYVCIYFYDLFLARCKDLLTLVHVNDSRLHGFREHPDHVNAFRRAILAAKLTD